MGFIKNEKEITMSENNVKDRQDEEPSDDEKIEIIKNILLTQWWDLVDILRSRKDLDKMMYLAENLKFTAFGMRYEDEDFQRDFNDLLKPDPP